jgi:hypothetical protein
LYTTEHSSRVAGTKTWTWILNKMWAEIKSKHCMGLYLKEMLLRRLRIYIVCVYVAASHRRVDVQADLYHTMSPVAYLSVEQSVYVTE